MSYILEALKKSDAERKRGEIPTLNAADQFAPPDDAQGKRLLPWILSAALTVAVLGLTGILVLAPNEGQAPQPVVQVDPVDVVQNTPQPALTPKPAPKPEPVLEAKSPVLPVTEPMTKAAPTRETMPAPVEIQPESVATSMPQTPPEPEPKPEPEPEPEPIVQSPAQAAPEPEHPSPVTIYTRTPDSEPKSTPPSQTVAKPEAVPAPEPTIEIKAKPVEKRPAQNKRLKSAKVYVDKAWGSIDKGFYNQALRDLDQAVKLEPNYADAWFARGWTNEKSGNELSALGDYGRAISAKPDHAFALFSRAYLNLYIGSVRSSVTDFVRTQGVAQDQGLRLYSHLWLYLSRTRAGQDAQTRLAQDSVGEKLDQWPGPLIRHFLGYEEPGRVIAAMDEGRTDARLEKRATGYFFLGISALNKGDEDRARTYFEKTLATGAVQFRQYDAAKRELDKLNR